MITFKKISVKNFNSVGTNPIEIQLDRSPTTLVTGKNGSGKSTILVDSITYALFNKPYRKVNLPQLINSINGNKCLVEIEFQKAKNHYKIRRGMRPKVFEIYKNNELIPLEAANNDYQKYLEQMILGMNYKSFTQIVILGSSTFTPFMQLSAADRRNIIEDVLDIQVFGHMNTLLKGRMQILKTQYDSKESSIDLCKEKIYGKNELLETLKTSHTEKIKDIQFKIDEKLKELSSLKSEKKSIQNDIDKSLSSIRSEERLRTKLSELENLEKKFSNNIKNTSKTIKFYHDNNKCDTCKQDIGEEHKEKMLSKSKNFLEQLEENYEKLKTSLSTHQSNVEKIDKIRHKVSDLNRDLTFKDHEISSLERDIDNLKDEKNLIHEDVESYEKVSGQLTELNETLSSLKEDINEIKNDIRVHNTASEILKDNGIKTKIIKQYVPIMNKLINKCLQEMELQVSFELDETFNETIKSRYHDKFTYSSFSEGEKAKIDISLLFTWREIAKLKNSATCNLLILDEVFGASLDNSADDALLNLLRNQKNTNIFCISHKADQLYDKMHSFLKFEKPNNFTRLATT